ncbi:hypothetical protein CSKR_107374 [Clonorchis sinensis]|uniref:Uncharacterized protein n=1 Tax=Clonorchis sinensis TaxID=79923 RepID=A0A3R7FG44_CLOSI|nr:hypothetical protein CSKR_107374 [Clonorchis sinensis]
MATQMCCTIKMKVVTRYTKVQISTVFDKRCANNRAALDPEFPKLILEAILDLELIAENEPCSTCLILFSDSSSRFELTDIDLVIGIQKPTLVNVEYCNDRFDFLSNEHQG